MHSIEIRFVMAPSNTLFDGAVFMCPENVTCWGSEGVKREGVLYDLTS